MAMNSRARAATESLTFLLVLAGVLAAANVLSSYVFARADWTDADLFTLSKGSRDVAKKLDDRMTLTGYFTEDLPPPFNATERYVRDLFVEYESASDGDIDIEIIHPETDDEQETAEKDGAVKFQHSKAEGGDVTIREGYRSIVIKYLGDKKVIHVGHDTAGLEYELTQKMKELIGDKATIGIVSGHEGPSLSKGLTKLRSVLPTYELKEVDLSGEVPDGLKALLVIDPAAEFSEPELKKLDKFVMDGGSLGVFGGAVKLDLENQTGPTATPIDTGLNRLLTHWGTRLEKNMVADAMCRRVPMRTQFGLQLPVAYPPIPELIFDEKEQDHPAIFRIRTATMPFTASLEMTKAKGDDVTVTVLGKSSENSWVMGGDNISLAPRDPREWSFTGPKGPFPVMAAIEGKLSSAFAENAAMSTAESGDTPGGPLGKSKADKPVRVFVSGSGMVLRDEMLPQGGQMPQAMAGQVALALNAIDWLSQDSDLIAIRAKNLEDPPLDVPKAVGLAEEKQQEAQEDFVKAAQEGDQAKAEEAAEAHKKAHEEGKDAEEAWVRTQNWYKWLNMLGVPAVFGLFGVFRWQLRQKRRKNIKL